MSSADPEGRDWIDRLAIVDLIYRYSDAVTRADWDQTEALFASDAIWESPAHELRFESAPAFLDFLSQTSRQELLIQTAHQPVVHLLGPEQARATTTIHEILRGVAPAEGPNGEAESVVSFMQYGIYYDDAAKLDGAWKFTHRLFVPFYRTTGSVTGEVIATRSSLLRTD